MTAIASSRYSSAAMTLIATISCSLCRRVPSTPGSSRLSKWSQIAGGCIFRHGTHFAANGKPNEMRSPWENGLTACGNKYYLRSMVGLSGERLLMALGGRARSDGAE
jgi:hypothetical protein